MTLSKDLIEHIALDLPDSWQEDEETHTCSVAINGFEELICNFFQVSLAADGDYPDGYVDSYAIIDPLTKEVIELYMHLTSNAGIENDRELDIKITNSTEGRMIYDQIRNAELDEWLDYVFED